MVEKNSPERGSKLPDIRLYFNGFAIIGLVCLCVESEVYGPSVFGQTEFLHRILSLCYFLAICNLLAPIRSGSRAIV